MPKEKTNIAQLQKQRNKIKEKAAKYPPGTVNMQFLCPSSTGPSSVYLFTDQCRYLFNCGEGTQRLAHEHRTKLARLEHIFMTRTSWSTIGGLPGLCLTVQDAGVPELTLYGPPGLDEMFQATRRFVVLRDLKVSAVETTTKDCEMYDDVVMNVKFIPISRKISENKAKDETEEEIIAVDQVDYYAHENKSRLKPKLQVKDSMERLVRRKENYVTSYICKLKPKPGTLDLEKCVERRVPPGPLLGQLKNGFDVKLEDGSIVMSKEVRGPDDPGPKFIFIDIPNEDYMDSFIANQQKFLDESDATPSVVVHFSPNEIISSPIYAEFISKFPETTSHLIANGTKAFTGFVAAHRIQYQLNQLDPQIFPVLYEASKFENSDECESLKKKMRLDSPIQASTESVVVDKDNLLHVSTLTGFHLRPYRGLDVNSEATINFGEYLKELEGTPGCLDAIGAVKKGFREVREDQNRENTFPRLVFLGTGSCIPNKTRNVSSILVHASPDACILLDCGEGTAAQIYRFYGKTKGREVLKQLKAIYVSHLHADHHLGLIGLLQERKNILGTEMEPLLLFAPKQIAFWLTFYDKRIEPINNGYKLIPNGDLLEAPFSDPLLQSLGLLSLRTCLVKHCPYSFGIAIETGSSDNATKITYSGDTMPCNDLITLGKDSTLLIHEATMEDDLEDEAKYKMHSTVSQAINQGALMHAKFTILTHFSQRYAKLPRFEFETLQENVGLAFDNMEVTLDDLPILPKLYPALKAMFVDHCEDMDQKAMKRALKKQREANSRGASPVKKAGKS